jgi:hypothetical protein
VLIDRFVGGVWRVKRERGPATVVVESLSSLPDPAVVEEEEDVTRLLEFLAPESDRRTIELAAWRQPGDKSSVLLA